MMWIRLVFVAVAYFGFAGFPVSGNARQTDIAFFLPQTTAAYIEVTDINKASLAFQDSIVGTYFSGIFGEYLSKDINRAWSKINGRPNEENDLTELISFFSEIKRAKFASYSCELGEAAILEAYPVDPDGLSNLLKVNADDEMQDSNNREKIRVFRVLNGEVVCFQGFAYFCSNLHESKRLQGWLINGQDELKESLANKNRKYLTARKRLWNEDCVGFVYIDPISESLKRHVISKAQENNRLGELLQSGLLELLSIGAVAEIGEASDQGKQNSSGISNVYYGRVLVQVGQPRLGIFEKGEASDFWNSDFRKVIPKDTDYVACYEIDVQNTLVFQKDILEPLFGKEIARLICSDYLGLFGIPLGLSDCFTGNQIICAVDVKPGFQMSETYYRAFELNSKVRTPDEIADVLAGRLKESGFERTTKHDFSIWREPEAEWRERRDSYFELASLNPESFSKNFVYPRSTMAFNDQVYMRFFTEEACEKAIESLVSVNQRGSTDLAWFEQAYHRIRKQPGTSVPFFLLFARNACGFSELLNNIGQHFAVTELGQSSSFGGGMPEIDEKKKLKYPELTISGWYIEDGYLFDIVESKGSNTAVRK